MARRPNEDQDPQDPVDPMEGTAPDDTDEDKEKYKCPYCDKPQGGIAQLGTHIRSTHKDEVKKNRAEAEKKRAEQLAAAGKGGDDDDDDKGPKHPSMKSEDEIYAEIRMGGMEKFHEQLRVRLAELLSGPQIPTASRDFILNEWDRDVSIRDDLNALYHLLYQDGGLKADRAARVIERLSDVVERYQGALQEAGVPPSYYPRMRGPAPDQMGSRFPQRRFPPPRGRPPLPYRGGYQDYGYDDPYGYDPYEQYYGGGYGPRWGRGPPPNIHTQENVVTRDQLELKLKENAEQTSDKVVKKLSEGQEKMVTIRIINRDPDGKPLTDAENNYVYDEMDVPASQALLYRKIMTEGQSKPSSDPRIGELNETVKTLSEKLDKANDKRQEDAIAAANKRADDAKEDAKEAKKIAEEARNNRSSSGWNSDGARLLSETGNKGISLAERIADRQPVQTIIKTLTEKTTAPATVPPEEEEAAPSAMAQTLKEQGLIQS